MKEDADDQALRLRIIADLLIQGHVINLLSALCSATTFGLLLGYALGGRSAISIAGLALSLLAGMVELWLAIRTGFDARLFRRLSEQPDGIAAFDNAMRALALMPPEKAGRSINARIAGARRLLGLQAVALVLQITIGAAAALIARLLA